MIWPSLPEMGAYGSYVWSAYLLTVGALGIEVLCLVRRHRAAAAQKERRRET